MEQGHPREELKALSQEKMKKLSANDLHKKSKVKLSSETSRIKDEISDDDEENELKNKKLIQITCKKSSNDSPTKSSKTNKEIVESNKKKTSKDSPSHHQRHHPTNQSNLIRMTKEEEDRLKLKKLIKRGMNEKKERLERISQQQKLSASPSLISHVNDLTNSQLNSNSIEVDDHHPHDQKNDSVTQSCPQATSSNVNKKILDKDVSKNIVLNNNNNKMKVDLSKKKHKSDPIDRSVQDLFKAEPVLKRSLSSSSSTSSSMMTTTPETAMTISNHNEYNQQNRRSSSTTSTPISGNEIQCPNSNCGRSLSRLSETGSLKSIYCNLDCLQTYCSDTIKRLRSNVKYSNVSKDSRRYCLIDKLNNVRNDGIPEKNVLDFIRSNQTFEILKIKVHSLEKTSSSSSTSSNISTTSHTAKSHPTKSSSSSNHTPTIERSSSISDRANDNDSRRKFVRSSIKEILNSR